MKFGLVKEFIVSVGADVPSYMRARYLWVGVGLELSFELDGTLRRLSASTLIGVKSVETTLYGFI